MLIKKSIFIPLLATSIIGLFIYVGCVQFPSFASYWLKTTLLNNSFENVSIDIQKIQTDRALINNIGFEYSYGDVQFFITAKDINLDWDWKTLKQKKIHSVKIESLKVTVTNHTKQPSESTTLSDVSTALNLLKFNLPELLPLNQINIKNIRLIQTSVPEFNLYGSLKLLNDNKRIEAIAKVVLDNKPLKIKFNSNTTSHHKLAINDQNSNPLLTCEIDHHPEQADLLCNLSPELVDLWRPELTKQLAWSTLDIKGELHSIHNIEKTNTLPGILLIDASELQWNEINTQAINLSFPFRLHQNQLQLAIETTQQANLEINQISTPEQTVERFILTSQFKGNLNPDEIGIAFPKLNMTAEKIKISNLGDTGPATIGSITAKVSGHTQSLSPFTLELDKEGHVTLQNLHTPEAQAKHISIKLLDSLNLFKKEDQNRSTSVDPTSLQVFTEGLIFNDLSLDISPVRFELKGLKINSAITAAGTLTANKLTTQINGQALDLTEITQDFKLNSDTLTIQGSLYEAIRSIGLSTNVNYDLGHKQAKILIATDTVRFSPEQPSSNLLTRFDLPITLVSGEFSSTLSAHWDGMAQQQQLNARMDTKLKQLGGAWQDSYFSNLSGTVSLQLSPQIRSVGLQTINVEQIDVGTPLTSTKIVFDLEPSSYGELPKINLHSASSTLLGGTIGLSRQVFDPNLSENELSVSLDGLKLEQVVSLYEMEDMDAYGTIDGKIPIRLTKDGIYIDGGNLSARKPGGLIRYRADTSAMAGTALGTEILFDSLKNFQYTELKVLPSYKPDGELILELSILGKNKDLDIQRPVQLNINLQQNLLKLLQSLRYVDGLSGAIDEKVRRYYQEQNVQ